MLISLFLFLPVAFCLFWIVIHCWLSSRADAFWLILLSLLDMALFLLTDSCYLIPGVSFRTLSVMALLAQLTAPIIIPLCWLYIERLRFGTGSKLTHPAHLLWIILPVILFTAAIVLTSLIGFNEAQNFFTRLYTEGNSIAFEYKGSILYMYYLWIVVVYRIVLVFELVSFVIWLIYLFKKDKLRIQNLVKFFKSNKSIRLYELQVYSLIPAPLIFASKLFLFKDFTDTHLAVVAIVNLGLTISLMLYYFLTPFSARRTLTLNQIKHSFLYNYGDKNKSDEVEALIGELVDEAEEAALRRIRDKIGGTLSHDATEEIHPSVASTLFTAISNNWDEDSDSLTARFQQLMTEEQLFLQPGLSLQDVADKMHTNKTYVSKLVNNNYNLGFPELVNILRVDYAEQYLLTHRDLKQSEVATACGFQSASSFNIIFKKITGVTPKVWAASHDNKS